MGRLPFLIAGIVPLMALAGPYGPFGPDEDYAIELGGCEGSIDVDQTHPPLGRADFSRADEQTRLRLTLVGISHYEAQVFAGGSPRSRLVRVPVQATLPSDVGLDDAICDDLNRDGVTDFVVSLWGHGNGFGASWYDRLIALSSNEGYRFWFVPTLGGTAEDFVTFGRIEPVVMITHDFVQTGSGDDQRSYFVHDLWAFRGDEIVSANAVDSRFPKWVRYTLKPNWRPARSVSDADRRSRRPPRVAEALP